MSDTELRVYIKDVYPFFCARGSRKWFVGNNLDFRDFLKHGCPISTLENLSDPLAQKVIDRVRNRSGNK